MLYTITQLKQGTGFSQDALFEDAAGVRALRLAIKELLTRKHDPRVARSFARGVLKATEAFEPEA